MTLDRDAVKKIMARAEAAKNYTPGGPVAPVYPSTMIEVCTALLEAWEREERLRPRLRECADLLENYADLDEMDSTEAVLVHSALEDAREALGTRTEATDG